MKNTRKLTLVRGVSRPYIPRTLSISKPSDLAVIDSDGISKSVIQQAAQ